MQKMKLIISIIFFETRQHILVGRKIGHVDIFDRFPGIRHLQETLFKNSLCCDCVYHLKKDLGAYNLGKATTEEVKQFDNV